MALALNLGLPQFAGGGFSGGFRTTVTQTTFEMYGSIIASGSYPTNGDPLDFRGIIGYTDKDPFWVNAIGKAGFIYQYDYLNRKMFVYCNTAGGVNAPLGEHTNAAYAAGVTGDTIVFQAVFLKQ